MSQALNPTTINASGQSTLIIPGDVGQYTAIDIYNASIFDLQVSGLPQGSIWLPMNGGVVLDPSKGLPAVVYFTPGQTTNLTSTPANTVLTTLFLQGEPHPDYGPYVNTRYTNVGGSISVTDITAQFLEGDAQALKLTEQDDVSGFPVIGPANGANIGMGLGGRDAGNVFRTIAEIHSDSSIEFTVFKFDGSGNFGSIEGQDLYLGGALKLIDSVFTAGLTGVAAVFDKQIVTGITSTANQIICNKAVTVTGFYRANCFVRVNNGVSGNNLTVQVTFASGFGTGAANDSFQLTSGGLGPLRADGTVSIANSAFYYGASAPFYAASGTNIVVNYRDPTNTPSDSIAALIEFLG